MDNNVITQEKLAQAQDVLVREVFVPAFVSLYNEKIARAGLAENYSIRTEDDLRQAMNLADTIMRKEAEVRQAKGSPFAKAASALDRLGGNQNQVVSFLKQANANPAVKAAVATLAQVK